MRIKSGDSKGAGCSAGGYFFVEAKPGSGRRDGATGLYGETRQRSETHLQRDEGAGVV